MKNTGVVRKVDELGRVVIPKEIRDRFKIEEETEIEFYVDGNKIVLQKQEKYVCILCETECEPEDKYCRHCGFELGVSKFER